MAYSLIETVEIATPTFNIYFYSVPQDAVDLELRLSARVGGTFVDENIFITLNGNTTDDGEKQLYGTGSSTGGVSRIFVAAKVNGGGTTANTFGSANFYIPNYTSSSDKSIYVSSALPNNATSSWQQIGAGRTPVGAVTEIRLYGSYEFQAGTKASLYKIS